MTTPQDVILYLDSEADRAASTLTPALRTLAITETDAYIGDGVTPAPQMQPPYEKRGSLAPVAQQVAVLAARPAPPPRQVEYSAPGTAALGMCARGPYVNSGFTAGAVSVRVDQAPTGAALTGQIIDGTTLSVLYTFTVAAGTTAYDDTGASFVINDQTQLKVNITGVGSAFPGSGLVVEIAASAGSVTSSSIGVDSSLTASNVGGASATLSWQYAGTVPASSHVAVVKAGTTAPASTTDGTAVTVDGATLTVQITGLAATTTYSAAVWPVASDGTTGTPATLSGSNAFTTTGTDTNPPGPITVNTSGVQWSSGSVYIPFTPPGDVDYAGVIVREKNNVSLSTSWSTLAAGTRPTEGHPASGALNATGDGYVYAASNGNSFTRTGLSASTGYSFAFWAYDAAGNINLTPVVVNGTTTAAATTGQGLNGKIPSTYVNLWTDKIQAQDLSAFNSSGQTSPGYQGWANAVEGPTARANVGTMVDPILGGTNYVMFLKQQRITNGWADSTSGVYKNHQGYFTDGSGGYTTNGTGTYGSRVGANVTSQSSGAVEFVWWMANADGTTATALGNNCKGLTFMWFPDTGWPADELDIVELFNAAQLGANLHFKNASGGNGQVHAGTTSTYTGAGSVAQPFNVFAPITTTLLWEPPSLYAGTGGVSSTGQAGGFGRIRIWHKQTGVTGDSGSGTPLTWFDTDKPYIGTSMTDDAVWRLLSQANAGNIGIACAWLPSSVTYDKTTDSITGGARFGAASGTGSTQRGSHAALIRSISWWKAA